jgi:dynein light chain Tctex-type 1
MQKNGAGLHTATSCYWDNSSDGALSHMNAKTNYRQSLSLGY